jgi:hypothetical protein
MKILKRLRKYLGFKKCFWPTCQKTQFPTRIGCWKHHHKNPDPAKITNPLSYKHVIAAYRYSKKQENTGWWLEKLKKRNIECCRIECPECGEEEHTYRHYYSWSPLNRAKQFVKKNYNRISFKLSIKTREYKDKLNPLTVYESIWTYQNSDPENYDGQGFLEYGDDKEDETYKKAFVTHYRLGYGSRYIRVLTFTDHVDDDVKKYYLPFYISVDAGQNDTESRIRTYKEGM